LRGIEPGRFVALGVPAIAKMIPGRLGWQSPAFTLSLKRRGIVPARLPPLIH
jgi:hypothetical protein